ncbi:putative Lipoprotein [uncultured Gammaproteobacteria bacterium]
MTEPPVFQRVIRLFRLLPVLAACMLAVACAGRNAEPTSPTLTERNRAEFQAMVAELERSSSCVASIEGKPKYAPLRLKSPDGPEIEPKYFSDQSKASVSEKKLIGEFVTEIDPCRPAFGTPVRQEHINIALLIVDTWDHQRQLYQNLHSATMSWGRFNLATKSLADTLGGAIRALRISNDT